MMLKLRALAFLTACTAAVLAGCDDDDSGGTKPQADSVVPVDAQPDQMRPPVDMRVVDMAPPHDMMPPEPDAAPDAAPDAEPDMMPDMIPDMAVADASLIDAGAACDDPAMCPRPIEQCVDGACMVDLRPAVYRIDSIDVVEPVNSQQAIEGALGFVIEQHQLNLLLEGGGYLDEGEYLWYIGNGTYSIAGGEYDYLRQPREYPIQNFIGQWLYGGGGTPHWTPGELVEFALMVPTGTVDTADGPRSCVARLVVSVHIDLEPGLDDEGQPVLHAQLSDGLLRLADAQQVNFRFNGVNVALTDFLDDADLTEDTNDDGVPDAYRFAFDALATPVTFIGDPPAADGSNRDPSPEVENPPECDG